MFDHDIFCRYFQENGRIRVIFSYGGHKYQYQEDMGLVPKKIQAKGKEAIEHYSEINCTRLYRQERAREDLKEKRRELRMSSVDRLVEIVSKNGVALAGRILRNDNGGGVRVFLEKPFRSKQIVIIDYPHGGCIATSGRRVFDDDGELTETAILDARHALVDLYKNVLARKKYVK